MPSESHETSEEKKFGSGNKECLEARAICSPDTSKTGDSSFSFYAECAERIQTLDMLAPDMRRTPWNYSQQFGPKITERISEEDLASYYTCIQDGSKVNGERKVCAEKPLDFSRKPISSVRKDEFPRKLRKAELSSTITSQRSQENGANSSDGIDDSCNDEEKFEPFAVYSLRLRAAMHAYGSENKAFFESGEYLHKMSSRVIAQGARRNELKRNGLKAANSPGSEDELHAEYSVNNSNNNNKETDLLHQPRKTWSKLLRGDTPPSQLDDCEMSQESNSHSENGFSMSKETNGFHIQDLLSQESPRRALFGRSHQNGLLSSQSPKEHPEKGQEITNVMAQPRTSPKPSANYLGKEENLPPSSTNPNDTANVPSRYTSPNHALNLPASTSPSQAVNLPAGYTSPSHSMPLRPARFSFGTIDRYNESNGVLYPYMPTAFTPNHLASFMSTGYAGEVPGYSRPILPYPPGTMLPAAYNSIMHPQPYQQSLVAGQGQQKSKKTRPFKEIDTSMILQQIQMPPEILNFDSSSSSAYNSPVAESNGPTAENSSPQSPDSQSNINSSSGNEAQQQVNNEEGGRKKGRRIPPEEKDERYLEKRRKNNIAAKKSRDERRRKEDTLAECYKILEKRHMNSEARLQSLYIEYERKERKLEMITASLISFREKCEGHTKELFEETFRSFLP